MILLTYDITDMTTFAECKTWLKEIRDHCPEDVKIYLIGNKLEDAGNRQVDQKDAMKFAIENNVHLHFEVSAKSGDGVKELF